MTLKQLQERCRYWQERLNLREWQIDVKWGDSKKLHGACWWHAEELKAEVTVWRGAKDKDAVLVHELLHLTWEGHAELTREYDVHIERAIGRITAALLYKPPED